MKARSRKRVKLHLLDGTYELFRNYFGAPKRQSPDGREVGAIVGLLRSVVALLNQPGTTHVACAFDHGIESFRNTLYSGYKTGEGIDTELFSQFHLAEEAVAALGIVVWPTVEFEADDALATAAARFREANAVEQILICSPDKDLAQSVRGEKVVCWDRRRDIILDDKGVEQKFGVPPVSIPDWLALVGDSADGYPGIHGWGARSASTILARFKHLENIPSDHHKWKLNLRGAERLSATLNAHRDDAHLYRKLATLHEDVPLDENLEDLEWRGARTNLKSLCTKWGVEDLPNRVSLWRD